MTSEEMVQLIDETRNVCRNVLTCLQSIKQGYCTCLIEALEGYLSILENGGGEDEVDRR
jgi:hypothetical protein